MSRRTRILKRFVNTLENRDIFTFRINDFDCRLKLQKFIYLYNTIKPACANRLKYSYNRYIHGPYSPSLAKDYYKLNSIETNQTLNLPEDFISLLEGKTERWLEIASTIMMLKKQYTNDEMDDLVEHVVSYKKTSSSFVYDVVNDLIKYGFF